MVKADTDDRNPLLVRYLRAATKALEVARAKVGSEEAKVKWREKDLDECIEFFDEGWEGPDSRDAHLHISARARLLEKASKRLEFYRLREAEAAMAIERLESLFVSPALEKAGHSS